jgi:hypothetical protein
MINKAAEDGPSTHRWWKDWRGHTAAVVGTGPSVKNASVSLLADKMHAIAINNAFKLAPWADALYSCDIGWWQHYEKEWRTFAGLKLTHQALTCRHFPGLERIEIPNVASDQLLIERPGVIGAGGNGGFQGFNLLVQFGVTRIALIGIDCNLVNGCHFHGRHPSPLNNPAESNVTRWRKAFNESFGVIGGLGIEVINCSPISTITAYPKMSVPEMLERWAP